jgi:MFS-type transporter involved in bile tolerance (Atg22 family)
MSPMLAVATSSVQETEWLATSTIVQLVAILGTLITAPFLRYYFGKIGYKYELRADA